MKHLKRIPVALLVLSIILALTGCSDANLKAIANAELDVAKGVTFAANTTAQLIQAGTISPAEAAPVSVVLQKILDGNVQAAAATKSIASLDPATRTQLLSITTPLVIGLQDLITNGTLGIKDEKAKTIIVASLGTVLTALQVIQGRLAQ